jgi:hypothetical protein
VAASFPEGGTTPVGIIHVRAPGLIDAPIGAPHPNSGNPRFIAENSLLFLSSEPAEGPGDIYEYIFGGTSSSLIASNRHIGAGGYKISPDGKRLLGAHWLGPAPNELYAIHLDDPGETLLATDLLAYQLNQLGQSAFAYTRDGSRVVYLNDKYTGTSSVPASGGAPTKISSGTRFLVSPYADRVATVESFPSRDADSLYVSDPANGAPSFAYDSNVLIGGVTFVPDDRGLLFVMSAATSGASERLRHLSFQDGTVTELGRWGSSVLAVYPDPGEMQPTYPVDPTGCYVVIDHDSPGAEGTSIALVPN